MRRMKIIGILSSLLLLGLLGPGAVERSRKLMYMTLPVDMEHKVVAKEIVTIQGIISTTEEFVVMAKQSKKRRSAIVNMPEKTRQLTRMVQSGLKNVTLLIDSPGGRVDVGMAFVETMRAAQSQGVHFTCIIDGKAMSMALVIFSECDTRRAVFGSRLMWHSAAFGACVRFNTFTLQELSQQMDELNTKGWAKTRAFFDDDTWNEHYKAESILRATTVAAMSTGGYLRVINRTKIVKDSK